MGGKGQPQALPQHNSWKCNFIGISDAQREEGKLVLALVEQICLFGLFFLTWKIILTRDRDIFLGMGEF